MPEEAANSGRIVTSGLGVATCSAAATISVVIVRRSEEEMDFWPQPFARNDARRTKATRLRDKKRDDGRIAREARGSLSSRNGAWLRDAGLGSLLFGSAGTLQNLDGFLHNWVIGRTGRRGSGLVQRSDVGQRRTHWLSRDDAVRRNRFAGWRVVVADGQNQSGAVIQLNQLLHGRCSVRAVANGFAAMVICNRAGNDFSWPGSTVADKHGHRLAPNHF